MNSNRATNEKDNIDLYTLYVEFMGALVPVLKARQTGAVLHDFVVFEPEYQTASGTKPNYYNL